LNTVLLLGVIRARKEEYHQRAQENAFHGNGIKATKVVLRVACAL
jgi:hypothetical protein